MSVVPASREGIWIRSYEPRDQAAVSHLYSDGLLAGQIAPNDSGADIENMQDAYFDDPRHHFWVAEVNGRVQGMIGVASDEPHTAEIRRLRVAKAHQQTELPALLVQTAIAHCKHHGFLKVRLDTRYERTTVLGIFDRAGFEHTRTRELHGKELLEFYLDLYRKEEHGPADPA